MKLAALLLATSLVPATAVAASSMDTSTQCESDKYHQYIDASLNWYQQLVDLSVAKDPSLKTVGDWFLMGRKHHFLFNRDAVDWYLANDKDKLQLSLPVESWLNLTQSDIKELSTQESALGQAAKLAFDDRQSKPHAKNYALRSAFAELLTHPAQIEQPLNAYNQQMNTIADIQCQ
ncbi:hypothetical protein L4C36_10050 [Photobacterium japonica]|uniref:hypothetical protein n=1 Tax=Photobacterium japonica TaxID=2910235 RepID=UPI003D102993